MRLITRADVDLAATLALCARMGNARTVLRRLRDRFEDPKADPRAVLDYGLCRAVFLLNDPNDSDKGPHQVAAAQAFSRCLNLDPSWWLPRYLRMEINSVLVATVPGVASEPPERDLDALLSGQAEAAESPPYFLSTHAALLRHRLRDDPEGTTVDKAVDKAVEEFATAVDTVGLAPAGVALPYLDLPFREAVLLLRHAGHDDAAASLKTTGLTLYPGSLPLQFA
jgi:hypothetical protein